MQIHHKYHDYLLFVCERAFICICGIFVYFPDTAVDELSFRL